MIFFLLQLPTEVLFKGVFLLQLRVKVLFKGVKSLKKGKIDGHFPYQPFFFVIFNL